MNITIIGGGAAGFMAAVTAAEKFPNAAITIIEKNKTVLNKVRVSGGGRCNVTNDPTDLRFFVKNYPRGEKFLRQLFNQFNAQDTVDWFTKNGVTLKTEADGRMFPTSNTSQTIIEFFIRITRALNINVRTSISISTFAVVSKNKEPYFLLKSEQGETFEADRVLIATGGHPKSSGYEWLQNHLFEINSPIPSLFTFNTPTNNLIKLAGVSIPDAIVKIVGTKLEYRGPLLITHWGFSGPAVLKLSAWGAKYLHEKNYEFTSKVNWVPELSEDEVREQLMLQRQNNSKQQIASHSRFEIPNRLWKEFTTNAEIPDTLRWNEASNKHLNRLVELLTNSQFEVKGKTTFKEEFVTCGGVALNEINPVTLESKRIPGLFFAGELLDVDGITGGFNFQNAWTTGYVVGTHIGKPISIPTQP